MLSGRGRRGKRRYQTSGLVRRCAGPPSEDEGTPEDGTGSPGDFADTPAPVSWAFRPPILLRSEPETGGSRSDNSSRNSRPMLTGSPVCWPRWKAAQIRGWICSHGSNRSYAWNTLFSCDHTVSSEELGSTTSNSDVSTVMRSAT